MPPAKRKPPRRKTRYDLFLNPYPKRRFTTCPKCDGKTRQRKTPLFIVLEPTLPVILNKTCRYCPYCDLLIVHQGELEGELAIAFEQRDPDMIGNPYHVFGTVDRPVWKKGMEQEIGIADFVQEVYEFKKSWTFTWYWGPADE
jgi:hypothetical protein